MKLKTPSLRWSRDTTLFVTGWAGIVYQTVIESADRPTLIVLFGAMVGLPRFLRLDEKHRAEVAAAVPPKDPA